MMLNDLKFIPHLPSVFNNPENGLNGHEHLFITPHMRVFDIISEYTNVEFCTAEGQTCSSLINKYGDRGDWLFVHGMSYPGDTLKIKNKYIGKVIWRTWGHDIAAVNYFLPEKGQFFRNIKKKIVLTLWRKKVSEMYAIGVGNNIDVLAVERVFGKMHTCFLSYADKKNYEELLKIKCAPTQKNDIPKILLGHSGHTLDNHFEIIDRLCQYKEDNFTIYIALSYGDPNHIKKVKKYAFDKLGDKVVIIDRFMSYEDYAAFLNEIDIAILDGKNSYALGNLGLLLFFRKKIYLNRNGIIKAAFDVEKIPHGCSDEVGKISFDEFIKPAKYIGDVEYSIQTQSFEYNLNNWKTFLKELKNFGEQL